jgi:hypothetical protein
MLPRGCPSTEHDKPHNTSMTKDPLETAILALTKYGKVHIMQSNRGWHCSVAMHVAAAGVSFDVASSYEEVSPSAAVNECQKRILDTLKLYKDKM